MHAWCVQQNSNKSKKKKNENNKNKNNKNKNNNNNNNNSNNFIILHFVLETKNYANCSILVLHASQRLTVTLRGKS